jgi:beta-N-acetylhexosaminidase
MPRFVRRLLCLSLAFAAVVPRVGAQDPADRLLRELSVEQKAGQLFMVWSLSRSVGERADNNHEQLLAAVRDAGLGGVILSLGSVDDAANLVPRLQAAAKVPLLLAADFEGGVWFRLTGATQLGNQMLVGATGSAGLAEAMGRITGEEAKALGFQLVFAPVLDVNSNPQNPIINVRSFGEDPAEVSRLGGALVKGLRGTGLLACGKHFPGHGDVDSDSHLRLPTVPGERARLDRVELRPFRDLAKELDAIMTGHLAVPGLGEGSDVPATLSAPILGRLLRQELGFDGVVVTDALEMKGIADALPPAEVAIRALLAGADVLLMPPDPLAARAAVVAAVASGRVPMARLDDAVLRILRLKQRTGLLTGGGQPAADWRSHVNTAAAQQVAAAIAARGLTLVRDRGGNLPLRAAPDDRPLLVTLLDRDEGQGKTFAQALVPAVAPFGSEAAGGDGNDAELRLSPDSSKDAIAAAAAKVAAAKAVVVALHVKVREYEGGIGLPPALRPVVAALRDDQRVIGVAFGNPYLVQHLPAFDTWLCAYVSTDVVERAAAAALRGQVPIVGRLPVTIPEIAPAGGGVSLYVGAGANATDGPELAAELPQQIEALLSEAVAAGAFPGAVCLVARGGRKLVELAVGAESDVADAPAMALDTPFDLASLTKVCATMPTVLRLCAADKLSLDDPVAKPTFVGTGKERVTVRHLLAHQGGLPAYERFYKSLSGRDAILAAAVAEDLMHEPGAGPTYSDVGFLLLMAVVEACSGERFEAVVAREVLQPFGLLGARFVPTEGSPLTAAAPTERDARRGLVHGFVHDENAFAMGGIAGHAGLFATAADVLEFGLTWLGGGRGLLPRELVELAQAGSGIGGDQHRGLGFQRPVAGSWAGTKVPAGTFGHTGFTGTSLWCCPRHDLCVVLLTNRVHPTRVNNKITGVRTALHDLVLAAVR